MVYYGNTVRALIKAGATTVELLTQQMDSAKNIRRSLTSAPRAFIAAIVSSGAVDKVLGMRSLAHPAARPTERSAQTRGEAAADGTTSSSKPQTAPTTDQGIAAVWEWEKRAFKPDFQV